MSSDPHGDFQTPPDLARACLARIADLGGRPATVVEPTCGQGTFLRAAAERFPEARLIGYERSADHLSLARSALPTAELHHKDAFSVDWSAEAATWTDPVWVVGNPPWVTASALGRLGAAGPARSNPGLTGLEARTGSANFDISEWVWLQLIAALAGRPARVGLLCKTQTARRVLGSARVHGVWRIDAARDFGVSVSAGLLVGEPGPAGSCPVFGSLDADRPEATWSLRDGAVVAGDHDEALLGVCAPAWRSGVKHDAARVFELKRGPAGWTNGLGEVVDIEVERLAPYLKASDLHRGDGPERALVLTQRSLKEDTAALEAEAPRTWVYLMSHSAALDGRKSSIWSTGKRFGLFGIGPYSFAPWKVAVSSLRSELRFRVVGPREGRPVLVDDTSYFLPFDREEEARLALGRLESPGARAFLEARSFAGSKRKITRKALMQLALDRVVLS